MLVMLLLLLILAIAGGAVWWFVIREPDADTESKPEAKPDADTESKPKPEAKPEATPKTWVSKGKSEVYGGSLTDSPYEFKCENSYVTGFYGKSGSWIDQIGINCSDGSTLGPTSGTGGSTSAPISNVDGYKSFDITYGGQVDNLTDSDGNKFGGTDGVKKATMSCGDDEKIIGIYGNDKTYVNSIGVECGKLE